MPKLSELTQDELFALRMSTMPRKTGGSKLHIYQQAQHKITPSCKWGLDVCPFDVANKQCSTCRCDKA